MGRAHRAFVVARGARRAADRCANQQGSDDREHLLKVEEDLTILDGGWLNLRQGECSIKSLPVQLVQIDHLAAELCRLR
eukprot:scaffold69420_cov28-Tisochrysis_lutea.AAC.3